MLDERATVSYPDGVQAEDGQIYIIYDRNRRSDKQILMATFTEQDVEKGQPTSDRCRLQELVHQAK